MLVLNAKDIPGSLISTNDADARARRDVERFSTAERRLSRQRLQLSGRYQTLTADSLETLLEVFATLHTIGWEIDRRNTSEVLKIGAPEPLYFQMSAEAMAGRNDIAPFASGKFRVSIRKTERILN
jgi:hypothetical protein